MSTSKFAVCCLIFFGLVGSATAVFPPPLPTNNPASVFNVTSFGAVGDGVSTNTTAIQNAINAAATNSAGGIVEIPAAGSPYLCGPLAMSNKVNLQIDSGATLMMLPFGSWPNSSTPFINGSSLHDVTISGSGTIDGQGAAWWGEFNTNGVARPNFINFSSTTRLLIQDVHLRNPPTFHLMLKGNNASITIRRIDIDTDPNSPNTDGMDLASTNILVQDCHISDGDDNIMIGGSSARAVDITVTNCMFGHGHGVSLGSTLQSGVSNLTVINCIFTNTDYGIRMKASLTSGGIVQGLNYYNLTMTNIFYTPLLIYSFYPTPGSPTDDGITPQRAASTNLGTVTTTTPTWRNIVISNVIATAGQPGMIWARAELPASNILLNKLNITASDSANSSLKLYSVRGVQVVDSQFVGPGGTRKVDLFNAAVTFSNTSPASAISLNGFAVTNALAFYNQPATLSDPTIFGATALTLSGITLSNTTSLTLGSTAPVNFTLGSSVAKATATGNLTLNNTLNVTNGPGFGVGTYTLFNYSGTFSGSPTLGATPPGYNYSLTNGGGNVNLVVTVPCINPTASVSGGGTICSGDSANIQATLTGTGPWNVTWSDGFVQNAVASSPAMRSVSPLTSTNYTVTGLSDATACPAGTLSGSASVNVLARPTANVSGGGQVCGGSSVNIQAALTGTSPWSVTWSDGFVQNAVTSSPATRSVSPPVSTNYTVTALSDSNGCPSASLSGSAPVTVCTPAPFQITSAVFLSPDQFVLTWDSVSNFTYQVQSADSVISNSWITNALVTATGPISSWTNTSVSATPQRFYRILNLQ